MTKIYNIQTLPQLAELELGSIGLRWTNHALLRAMDKQIAKPNTLIVHRGTVVEVEVEARKVTKAVVRIAGQAGWDSVYVLVPDGLGIWKVLTCWKNHSNDTHKTLNMSRVA